MGKGRLDILDDRSGVVVHESVADGSIWFGHDSRRTNPDGTVALDITGGAPTTVAIASGASNGTVIASGVTITYQPNAGAGERGAASESRPRIR